MIAHFPSQNAERFAIEPAIVGIFEAESQAQPGPRNNPTTATHRSQFERFAAKYRSPASG
jgi:hypothetical protein